MKPLVYTKKHWYCWVTCTAGFDIEAEGEDQEGETGQGDCGADHV